MFSTFERKFMKAQSATIAILLLVGSALAQTSSQQSPAPHGTPAPSATAAPAAQSAPADSATKSPQAKTKEEFDAYKAAASLTDPNQILAAADQFAQKFPTSDLKVLLYVQAMNIFQQQNNSEKEIEAGRKALALDPTDPVPLIHVASALVEITRENDLDRDQRYAEAAKDAQAAIDNINTGLHIPPSVTPQQVAAVKSNIVATGYETLGVIAMHKQDFASAENDFKKAAEAASADPIARVYLRLSVAQDNEKKYAEALDNARKALQYSQPGTVEQNLAKQQMARLEKLVQPDSTSSLPGPGATPPPGPAPTNPTAPPTTPQTTAPQPH
jgi:tetratricopeptide (TPR) repeat protein